MVGEVIAIQNLKSTHPAPDDVRVFGDVLPTQVTRLSTESGELLLEGVVVLGGSRDEQESPLRREPKRPEVQGHGNVSSSFINCSLIVIF